MAREDNVPKFDVFKKTEDDWNPSYYLDKSNMAVKVSFIQMKPVGYRIHVWGSDDSGMELESFNESEAWTIYLTILGLPVVNFKELMALGFKSS